MAYESFRSWQSRSIEQKQRASALLLTLSGAALGFSVSLLSDQHAYIGSLQSAIFHVHGAAHLISILTGIAFSMNRVRDFDLTSQVARLREKHPAAPGLASKRIKVRHLGRITRWLYYAQAITFSAGALAFVTFALLRFGNVLYPA